MPVVWAGFRPELDDAQGDDMELQVTALMEENLTWSSRGLDCLLGSLLWSPLAEW